MVFHKGYDRALWMMLQVSECNEKYNADLIELINSFTPEMYEFIHSFINSEYNSKIIDELVDENFSLVVEHYREELFLTLKQVSKYFPNTEEIYELSLIPISDYNLAKENRLKNFYIGSFNYKINTLDPMEQSVFVDDSAGFHYYLSNNMFGYYLKMKSKRYGELFGFGRIDINRMPNEIYSHYFDSEKRMERLVRRRKK